MILTEKGKIKVTHYIKELEAKKKEILDANKDTCDETSIPTKEDILCDIEYFDDGDEYINNWAVTDNYCSDYPLWLIRGIHYKKG